MTTELKRPIVQIKVGPVEGKQIAIIVGVHGNEKGPQLEWEWLNGLSIISGSLYLIFANPSASDLGVRFVNVNLNRRFGMGLNEYPEDVIAREIEEILDKCDALLDLHMYNETMDRPFAICNAHSNSAAKVLPIDYVVNIPDEINGGGTDDYMARSDKIGVCFETGSVERPDDYSEIIRQGVIAFLASFGLIESPFVINSDLKVLTKDATKFVINRSFRFARNYSSFDRIKKGELICTEDNHRFIAENDCFILFPRPNNPIGTEAYYLLTEARS